MFQKIAALLRVCERLNQLFLNPNPIEFIQHISLQDAYWELEEITVDLATSHVKERALEGLQSNDFYKRNRLLLASYKDTISKLIERSERSAEQKALVLNALNKPDTLLHALFACPVNFKAFLTDTDTSYSSLPPSGSQHQISLMTRTQTTISLFNLSFGKKI